MKRMTTLTLSLGLAAAVALGCAEAPDSRHYETALHRFDVSESSVYLTFPSTQRVLDEFLSLVVNFEGMDGVLELVSRAGGIDMTQEDFLAASGLDPQFQPLVFEYQGAEVVVLGIADMGLWKNFMQGTLKQAGKKSDEIRTAQQTSLWDVSPTLAWAREGNLWVLLHNRNQQALGHLARLLLTPLPAAPLDAGDEVIGFRLRIPQWDMLQAARPMLTQMGPAAGLGHALIHYLEGCRTLSGTITPGDRYLLTIHTEGCQLPFAGEVSFPPEEFLAEDTVATLTLRQPGDSLAAWLSTEQWALITQAWTQLPAKPKMFEDLTALLKAIEPEITLAFLGLSDTVSVANLFAPKDPMDPLFALHLQLILTLKKGADGDAWLGSEGLGGLMKGYVPRDLATDRFAKEYCQEKNNKKCFSLIRIANRLIAVSGAGEGSRLLRTIGGQARSLKSALFAQQSHGPLTFTLKTRRLVRDLVSKGFPPYFLAVLSSILETRVTARPSDKGSELTIEVVLR